MGGVVGKAACGYRPNSRWPGVAVACAILTLVAVRTPCAAETLQDALVKTYQTNPQLNAERARQRGRGETVPRALTGSRPHLVASLSSGLQAVHNILPGNTVQSATLKP